MQEKMSNRLVDCIPLRHSVRTFMPQALPEEMPEQIRSFFAGLEVPFEHNVRLELFKAEPGKKLYNNGVNPVDNLGVLAQTDLVSVSKVGFVGQLVMLYAVSLGLSTCWFGHYKLSELGKHIPNIAGVDRLRESTLGYGYGRNVDVGERVICCMPFGVKNEASRRLVDLVGAKTLSKRKPVNELMERPDILADCPQDIKDVLELARLAPSAANSQMWRFGLDNGFRTITVAKPIGYKHFKWEHPDVDVGMCAAHIWLGLLQQGYRPRVEVGVDSDRAFWSFEL